MKPENAIEIRDVKKRFKVYFDKGRSLKEKLLFLNRNHYEERWVLKGINFDVKRGEAIGLIGKNGCGKSTTLKLLSRIIYPTEGNIEIQGRVSSLLELGAGFHADLSGRENIYTNASIFGLKRKEIDARLNDIIEFSEMKEFLDNPVRTYSSGMYMRLAFSVAINVDADVLLIDEILAVGDVAFQAKCFERLKEIKKKGTTIIIVSHSMGQIEQICDRSIWIKDGLIQEEGIPKFVDDHYLAEMEGKRLEKVEEQFQRKLEKQMAEEQIQQEKQTVADQTQNLGKTEEGILPSFCCPMAVRSGSRFVEFTDVKLMDENHTIKQVFQTGEKMIVKMRYSCELENILTNYTIGITRDDGMYCYGSSVLLDSNEVLQAKKEGEAVFIIEKMRLLPGKYFLDVGLQAEDYTPYDTICSVLEFRITTPVVDEFGVLTIEHTWMVDGKKICGKHVDRS